MTTTSSTQKKSSFFINRNFALLWGGQSISLVGDYIFNATLLLWIGTRLAAGQTWAPLAISGALIATTVPTLFIGPIAGVFVDRWDTRRTMLIMDASRAFLTLLLLIVANGGVFFPFIIHGQLTAVQQIVVIYVIVFLMMSCAQFFNPASVAILGDIVEEVDLTRATSREQATTGLATIMGLSLSAPLFFGLGIQWALLMNALSFIISFISLLAIRLPKHTTALHIEQRSHFLQEFRNGLQFYAHNTTLVTILIAASLFVLGAGTVNTLNLFFVTQNLHAPASLFSYVNAVFGAGAILGAVIAGQGAKRLGPRNMFWISLLLSGLLLLIYAHVTSPILALITFFLLGLPNAITNAMVSPLLLAVTPREFIGRTVAVLFPTLSLVRVLSMLLAGYLDSSVLGHFQGRLFEIRFGTIDTIFSVAGLFIIIGSIYALFHLRRHGAAIPAPKN